MGAVELPPEAFREEERAVVDARVLVDEDVAAVGEVRPQVDDAVVEAGFVVDVEEAERDRLGVVGERVVEPALAELAAVDRAVAPHVFPHVPIGARSIPSNSGRA